MKLTKILLILSFILSATVTSKHQLKRSQSKTKAVPLPEWLIKKGDKGEYKVPNILCDNLEENVDFYAKPYTIPEDKVSNKGIFYIAPNSGERLKKADLVRQDYVSNLKRAIDTYAISFWPIEADKVIMTSDIQEFSIGTDAKVNDAKRKKGTPFISNKQKESLDMILNDSDNKEVGTPEQKKLAKEGEVKRFEEVYQSLKHGKRVKSHEGWSLFNKFNDLFMQDLEEECSKGTQVVVATGHSLYWQEFIKSNSSKEGTCKTASAEKLGNGAIISMVVKFNDKCKRHKKESVANCKLLLGQFHHSDKTNCKESNYNDQAEEIKKNMEKGDRQILLIAQRHGTSHWNVAKGFGKLSEAVHFDSPLWPTGVLDAVAVYNRLNKQN